MKREGAQMNVTGSSERSILLPLLFLAIAMVGLWTIGGGIWLVLALGGAGFPHAAARTHRRGSD
jgi:hypothetical protein